jgi:hypothetical protein
MRESGFGTAGSGVIAPLKDNGKSQQVVHGANEQSMLLAKVLQTLLQAYYGTKGGKLGILSLVVF